MTEELCTAWPPSSCLLTSIANATVSWLEQAPAPAAWAGVTRLAAWPGATASRLPASRASDLLAGATAARLLASRASELAAAPPGRVMRARRLTGALRWKERLSAALRA